MKRVLLIFLALACTAVAQAQERRPIDNQHPMWLIHVDVWYKADPQKIIDLIPEDIRPYVCLNLSLSCQYDKDKNQYKMPHYAFQTYKSWGTVCQQNGMFFTCQPASGGHTHIQDDDLATFEYFFRRFPNFLGWNYAEQFWGFDEAGDKSSSTQTSRWALFAKLVEMSHKYGGFLTVSFCGNIWSHPLNPIGEMKRNKNLLNACKQYPEAILWLYKYTTSSCFYNNESVTWGPFVSGLAKNYGVRYDNCGWNGALGSLLGDNHGKKYPAAAGIGTVMEQMAVNGGAVWDGPELTWNQECFHEIGTTTVDGYTRRQWERFPNFNGVWMDMFRKVLDGTIYIPTREEVVAKTKIVVINNVNTGSDEQQYATWGNLYDGVYKQTDPFNRGNGQWMDNFCYFKSTGRYGTIPMVIDLYDEAAKAIPVQVKKSNYTSRWSTIARKTKDFNDQYPEVSVGDLYVNRYRNQLVTYTPYTYLNSKTGASARIPLQYNTCDTLELQYDKLSSGVIREYEDHIDFYLNNYRSDTTALRKDIIILHGTASEPTYTFSKHTTAKGSAKAEYDAESGVYTLTVQHCGAVEITLNCQGTAPRAVASATPYQDTTPRAVGDGSSVAPAIPLAALPLPLQPAPYRGEILIEAEDMDYKSIKSCCTDPFNWYSSVIGHSGNGFVDMGTSTSGALRHQLTLRDDQAGDYVISVRYTCPTKAGNIALTVNSKRQTVRCEQTATNEWAYAQVEATLKAGKNTLVIINTGALPMYVDQVSYRPADVAPMTYDIAVRQTEHGTVTPDVTEAAEGDTVTLQVSAEEGFQLKQLRVVNSVFYTLNREIPVNQLSTLTFVMPNDNVTLQPVFADATSAYSLDLSEVVAGAIPAGWRCTQENNDVHEYPSTFSSGARTFSGFTGHQGKALYWRSGSAEYGRQTAYPLTLEPGSYKLTFAMAAWKGTPRYKVSILNATTGRAIATSATYSATPNANGSTSANVTSAQDRTMEFTVEAAGKYVIRFSDESSGSGLHEFLLLECKLNTVIVDGIASHPSTFNSQLSTFNSYSINGMRRTTITRGINIVRTADSHTRKIIVK
ncbi:MAG: glycosyl hydrolase family 98 [Bacteroidaceae bacterium]|nr:glycosyl hydrolase family 98 [Bacteroidaceae bacterium]